MGHAIDDREGLIQLYEIERSDANSQGAAVIALNASWLALVGVLGYVLTKSGLGHPWILAFLPLVPLPLGGSGALLIAASEIRSKLLRAYEMQLMRTDLSVDGTPVPSHQVLTRAIWMPEVSPERKNDPFASVRYRRPAYLIFVGWIYLPLLGSYLGIAIWSLVLAWHKTEWWIALIGTVLTLVACALFTDLLRTWRRLGDTHWPNQVEQLRTQISQLRAAPK